MADSRGTSVEPANMSYGAIIEWMGWKNIGIINALSCSTPADLEVKEYEADAYEMGKNL